MVKPTFLLIGLAIIWSGPALSWSFSENYGQCLLSGDTSSKDFGFFAIYVTPESMLYRFYQPVVAPAQVQVFLGANNNREETGRNAVLSGPHVDREQMVYKAWNVGQREVGVYQALPRVEQLLWQDLRQGAAITFDITTDNGESRHIELANGDFTRHYEQFVQCVQALQFKP